VLLPLLLPKDVLSVKRLLWLPGRLLVHGTLISSIVPCSSPTIRRERTSPVTWLLLLRVNREERTIELKRHERIATSSPLFSLMNRPPTYGSVALSVIPLGVLKHVV
jgi:hypothetical protein